MSIKDIIIVAYIVMAICTTGYVQYKLGGPAKYRLLFATIVGLFWPIPIGLLLVTSIEELAYDIINWFETKS